MPLPTMRLSRFIAVHIDEILVDWVNFARGMLPAAETMSLGALRDHAHAILLAIAQDMEVAQSEAERKIKSEGMAEDAPVESAATSHGLLRQRVGFDLVQLAGEYRALRATVVRLWMRKVGQADAEAMEDMVRFNEGIDQALAESIASYSTMVADSRDTFLAVLGHDLRTPLGAIGNCVYLLGREEVPPPTRAKALLVAKRSLGAVNQMITDLLEYTRSRLGRGVEVRPQPGALAALCRDVCAEVQAAFPERTLTQELPAQPLEVPLDAPRIRQVLINLLTNAMQHGDAGQPVTARAWREDATACVEIHNFGRPIPPDAMQVIFDPLVQIEAQAMRHAGDDNASSSLGLGLFIVREIVTAHGGTVTVTSTQAEGTTFRIGLPAGV